MYYTTCDLMSSLLLDSKYNNHEYFKKIKIYGYFSCLHPSWTCKDSGADGSCYLALIGLVSNPSSSKQNEVGLGYAVYPIRTTRLKQVTLTAYNKVSNRFVRVRTRRSFVYSLFYATPPRALTWRSDVLLRPHWRS